MADFEQGFRDALRRIDVMDAPVAGVDAAELTRRSEVARRRRTRVRALLVAAVAALVATAAGLAGLFSGSGQAGPVVGVPVEPGPSRRTVMVDPPSADAMPGAEVVVDDPDTRGGASQRAVFIDGNTVYLADPAADEVRIYRDARLAEVLRTPKTLQILDLAIRDDVFYVIGRVSDQPDDGAGAKLGALTRIGDGLGATELPDGVVSAEPASFVRLGQDLVVVDVSGKYSLVAGTGPLPEPPSISYEKDLVRLRDGQFDAELHTRSGQTVATLLARDASYSWYQVSTTAADDTVDDVVYQFTLAGDLVATYACPVDTERMVAGRQVTVADGKVYWLRVTKDSVVVTRLHASQSGSSGGDALPEGFRWVDYSTVDTRQQVRLAVPSAWGRGSSPSRDYCFRDRFDFPGAPYVDDNHGLNQFHAITCPDLTAAQQALHVTVTDPSAVAPGPPWNGGTPGWAQWSRTVSGVLVTVTGRTSDKELAGRILDTIRVSAR